MKLLNSRCSVTSSFLILTVSLIFTVFLTSLFQITMHPDGVLYAVIARDMAHGAGSFWAPVWFYNGSSPFGVGSFFEHPPLGLWLESLYFRFFGDGFVTERLFCLTEAFFLVTGIIVLWKRVFNEKRFSYLLWVPVFISYTNLLIIKTVPRNFLDTTLTCFSLWAAIFIARDKASFFKNRVVALMLGSLFMFLGFLSNGIQAFFPIMIPLFDFLVRRQSSWKASTYEILFMLLMIAAMFLLLFYLQPASFINIKSYIFSQVLPSTIGARFNSSNLGWGRLHILIYPVIASIVGLFLIAIFYFSSNYLSSVSNNKYLKQNALFFFLIALSASLPVVLAHRQVDNYILQSMPFYVLTISVILTPCFAKLIDKIKNLGSGFRILLYSISLMFLFIAITVFSIKFGTPGRAKKVLKDINTIGGFFSEKYELSTSSRLSTAYGVRSYFERYTHVHLSFKEAGKYYLSYCNEPRLNSYKPVDLDTHQLCLFSHIKKE